VPEVSKRESDYFHTAAHDAEFSRRRYGGRRCGGRRRQHLFGRSATEGADEIRQAVEPAVLAVPLPGDLAHGYAENHRRAEAAIT